MSYKKNLFIILHHKHTVEMMTIITPNRKHFYECNINFGLFILLVHVVLFQQHKM